ncbi:MULTISPECIES: hypothetical protein [unclassified Bacillus (in: firmicutes)]|uniref:hypothetical protein n=1 Tax=unclassified Bacillus (in: firmicutes) TaxID=185979 RepID=UPI000BEF6D10|nr:MULTISPECIES: hypothetical protein [unclassified Bacillus (in: firmicutes)]PEJ59327.1 hypothetical protein CN692_05645 [Bacillus sp. AFS002410]PEL05649.1 hypothetical protein CN601_21600 [Bacillus sp. AFS017336]
MDIKHWFVSVLFLILLFLIRKKSNKYKSIMSIRLLIANIALLLIVLLFSWLVIYVIPHNNTWSYVIPAIILLLIFLIMLIQTIRYTIKFLKNLKKS